VSTISEDDDQLSDCIMDDVSLSSSAISFNSTMTDVINFAKTVRFAINDGNVACERINNGRVLTRSDIRNLWYTEEDFKTFRSIAKHEVRWTSRTQYRKNFLIIYGACGRELFQNEDDDTAFASALEASAVVIAESGYRGYERAMFSMTMKVQRSNHVRTILDVQELLDMKMDMSQDERVEALACTSRNSGASRRSRRIAIVLAKGDAIVADWIARS
jgi:hypothetical protein